MTQTMVSGSMQGADFIYQNNCPSILYQGMKFGAGTPLFGLVSDSIEVSVSRLLGKPLFSGYVPRTISQQTLLISNSRVDLSASFLPVEPYVSCNWIEVAGYAKSQSASELILTELRKVSAAKHKGELEAILGPDLLHLRLYTVDKLRTLPPVYRSIVTSALKRAFLH